MVSQVDKLQAQQARQRQLQRDLNRRLQQAQLRRQQQAIQRQQKEEPIPTINVAQIETEISSFKDNLTFENYAEKYAQLSEEAKKYVDAPSKIRESSSYKQYQSEKESIKAINKEISEWKQAEKIYFKISSGQSVRYDPRSSVGRKVNSLFTQFQKAQASLERLRAKQEGVVFVDGKGFSVAPHLQEDFVKSFDVSPKIDTKKLIPFEPKLPTIQDSVIKKQDLHKDFSFLSSEENIAGSQTTQKQVSGDFSGSGGLNLSSGGVQEGTGFIQPLEDIKPTGLFSGLYFDTRQRIQQLRTEKARGDLSVIEGAEKLGLSIASPIIGAGAFGEALFSSQGRQQIYEQGKDIFSDPFGFVKQEGKSIGIDLKQNPEDVFAGLTGELLLAKGTGKVVSLAGRGVTEASRISPRFKPISTGIKTFDDIPEIDISTGEFKFVSKPTGELGAIRNVAGTDIQLAGRLGTSTAPLIPIKEQIKIAGKIRPSLVTAQADFPKKFLKGTPLEKPLFADPSGRLRISRLGLEQKEAGILDILSGDFTFKRGKPKAFIFRDQPIASFPRNIHPIIKKIKQGKPLTQAEQRAFNKFQFETPTGEFKTPGFLSTEPEVIAGVGETLEKVGKEGFTIIKGRRVPIYELNLKKVIGIDKDLDRIINLQKLKTSSDLIPLKPRLSLASISSPLLSAKLSGLSKLSGVSPSLNKVTSSLFIPPSKKPSGTPIPSSKIVSKPILPKSYSPIILPSKVPTSPIISSPPIISPPILPPPVPTIGEIPKPIKRPKKDEISKTKKRDTGSYLVYYKQPKTGKFKKVTKTPIKGLDRARDTLSYTIDQTLSRQGKIVKTQNKPKPLNFNVPQDYWKLNVFKFRPYKIRKGQKRLFRESERYIEKKAYVGDRRAEIQKLNTEKWIADQRRRASSINNYNKRLNRIWNLTPQKVKQPKSKKRLKTNIDRIINLI